jgi:CHAD domain-containing protein
MAAHPAEPRAQRYDTAECHLAGWGVALLRCGNVWVVELPPTKLGILASRTRFEFPGPRAHPPEEALDLLAAFARGAPLVRVLDAEIEAMTAPSADPPPDPAPPTPGAVIRAALLASVSRWIHHDPGVRLGLDSEDVHQARVSTRRLRSDLGSFEALLDREWARALRAELRPFASALGAVRDLDVLLARLQARVAPLEPDEARAAAGLLAGLERERADARAELLARMRAPEYLALLDRCLGAAREPALLEGADATACDALVEGLRSRWRRLERDVRRAGEAPAPEVLHAIRIRAKRCRYAAEALAGVDGKRVKALARALARLQDVLGEHQDAIIAASWLRRAGAHASDEGRFAAGVLAGAELAAAEAARGGWRREWRRARDCASRAQVR